MSKGSVSLVLHAHLPYVRHPERSRALEERWLFEALSETYIPLLSLFERLLLEGVPFKVTMSLTPPLLSMLNDPLLQGRYICYLNELIDLCAREIHRTRHQPEFNLLAEMYHEKYKKDLDLFENHYHRDIVKAFRSIKNTGSLEIIASSATHGYLPLMSVSPQAMRAQIAIGVKTFRSVFGDQPSGIWLPECGYVPQVEQYLKENGIVYFLMESHGVLFANPRPVFGTFSPIVTPNGLVAFGRDTESSKQVWSAKEGYPGDYDYRDFYRDIGYDLDLDYIQDFILPDGHRIPTGIKYFRITGPTDFKQPYNPEWAKSKAELHAGNFVFNRQKQIHYLSNIMDRPPIVVCPYDAELFGHWWYEGPHFLYTLFKKAYFDQDTFKLATLSEAIHENPTLQVASPCPSSWGMNGYNEVWLNSSNEWIYRHLNIASEQMVELASQNSYAEGLQRDALNQAARELLLAQSSDWAFIIKTGTMTRYAQTRTQDHIHRFTRLYHDIKEQTIDEGWLKEIQGMDNIFPDLDYRIYAAE